MKAYITTTTLLLISYLFCINTMLIHAQPPPIEPDCPLQVFELQRPVAFNIDQTVTTQIWTLNTSPPACCLISPAAQPQYNAANGPFNLIDVNGMPAHQSGIGTFVTISSVGVTDGGCGNLPNSNPNYLGGSVEQVQQDGWLIIPQGVTFISFQLKSPTCNRADAAALWLGTSITNMVQVGQKLNTSGVIHDYTVPPNAVDICGFKALRLRYYSYDSDAASNTILSWDIGNGNGFVDVTNTLIQSMGPNQNPDSDDNIPTFANIVHDTTKLVKDVDGEYFTYDANTNTFTGVLIDPFDIDADDEGAVDACIVATEIFPTCEDYLTCTGGLCPTVAEVDISPTACNYLINQPIDATPTNQPTYIDGYIYNWSNGAATANISPTLSGVYTVTVTANYDWHGDNVTDLQCETVVWADVYDPTSWVDNSDRCGSVNTIDVTVSGGQPAFYNSLSNYSFTSNLDGFLGNADASGNIIFPTASCGTHTITIGYDYLDPYNNFVNTGEICTETMTVEVYDALDLQSETATCGEIDITNITGGWDANCTDFATVSSGYTVTITGPNNSALITASNYTISAITNFVGVEFTAGQNGVPLNGLAGGNYTITVDDGRNANCLETFTIDITGCCPASSNANTAYELCGLNTPSFQPSSGSTLPNTIPTFGDLPDLTINDIATNLILDAATELSLNLDDTGSGQDIGGDGVDWFLGNDPLTDTPYTNFAMISDGICNAQMYTIYAFLRCDGDHDGAFNPVQTGNNTGQATGFDGMGSDSYIPAGQVVVTVWPEIAIPDISYPNFPVECQINLTNPCPNVYQLEVTDEDGNNYLADNSGNLFTGAGNQYTYDGLATSNPGTIGDLTLNISNPLAIAAFGNGNNTDNDNVTCSTITFERPYVCCLAEGGGVQAGLICPDPSVVNTALTLNIGSFRGDPIISPQLPNYCTYLLIVEKSTNNICGVLTVACSDNTGFLATDNRPISIPYSDFNTNYCGVGIDYEFYVYNYFLSNPPANNNLPQGINNGSATNMNAVISASSPEDGCYDVSIAETVFIPEPMNVLCDNDISQGNGGVVPFYYNTHEICIEGGTAPYNYVWETTGYVRHAIIKNNGATGEEIRIIYADNASWYVTVYDANGCTYDDWALSNENTGLSLLDIDNYLITNATLNNSCNNGAIDLQVVGGTPPYTYNWIGPSTWQGTTTNNGSTVNDATIGWYSVTVSDSSGETTQGWYWVSCIVPGRGKVTPPRSDYSLQLAPNPAASYTNLYFDNVDSSKKVLHIYNLQGKKIVAYKLEETSNKAEQYRLNTSNLTNGVYLLCIISESGNTTYSRLMIVK